MDEDVMFIRAFIVLFLRDLHLVLENSITILNFDIKNQQDNIKIKTNKLILAERELNQH
jgi:hypothetical protein